eukprot:Em0002g950a
MSTLKLSLLIGSFGAIVSLVHCAPSSGEISTDHSHAMTMSSLFAQRFVYPDVIVPRAKLWTERREDVCRTSVKSVHSRVKCANSV